MTVVLTHRVLHPVVAVVIRLVPVIVRILHNHPLVVIVETLVVAVAILVVLENVRILQKLRLVQVVITLVLMDVLPNVDQVAQILVSNLA